MNDILSNSSDKQKYLLNKNFKIDIDRKTYLDALSGLLIIHMILGHVFQWAGLTDYTFYKWQTTILFFFMPWFFFKSGMLHNSNRTIKEILSKSINGLIKPCLPALFIGLCIYWWNLVLKDDFNWIHYFLTPLKNLALFGDIVGNSPLWFIVALFLVKPIFHLLSASKPFVKIIYILLLIGMLLIVQGKHLPQYIQYTGLGLLFYGLGYYFKEVSTKNIIIIISLLIYTLSIFYPQFTDFHTGTVIHGSYWGWIISSFAGIILINYIFKTIPSTYTRTLTAIGKRSMSLFIWHWPILYFTNTTITVLYNKECHEWEYFSIYLAGCVFLFSVILLKHDK